MINQETPYHNTTLYMYQMPGINAADTLQVKEPQAAQPLVEQEAKEPQDNAEVKTPKDKVVSVEDYLKQVVTKLNIQNAQLKKDVEMQKEQIGQMKEQMKVISKNASIGKDFVYKVAMTRKIRNHNTLLERRQATSNEPSTSLSNIAEINAQNLEELGTTEPYPYPCPSSGGHSSGGRSGASTDALNDVWEQYLQGSANFKQQHDVSNKKAHYICQYNVKTGRVYPYTEDDLAQDSQDLKQDSQPEPHRRIQRDEDHDRDNPKHSRFF